MEYTVKHLKHFATDIVNSVGAETLVSKRVLSKKQHVLNNAYKKVFHTIVVAVVCRSGIYGKTPQIFLQRIL